ncbi:hypothetical protein AN1V17_51050 [Vallitalea sediminicola]
MKRMRLSKYVLVIVILISVILTWTTAYAETESVIDASDTLLYEFEDNITQFASNGKEFFALSTRLFNRDNGEYGPQAIITSDFKDVKKTFIDTELLNTTIFYDEVSGNYISSGSLIHSDKENYPNNKFVINGSSSSYYELDTHVSKDGVNWERVSGSDWISDKNGNLHSRWAGSSLQLFDVHGALKGFIGGSFLATDDRKNFVSHSLTKYDPYKLTPKQYNYLGNYSLFDKNILYNGKYYVAQDGDYYGNYMLRSDEGINWNIVTFLDRDAEKRTKPSIAWYTRKFVANDVFYAFIDAQLHYSYNGKDWIAHEFNESELMNREYVPYIAFNDGYFMVIPTTSAGKLNFNFGTSILFSKDMKNFIEVDFGEKIDHLLYMDKDVLVTANKVLDYNLIKKKLDAYGTKYYDYAEKLNKVGMFKGTELGYELDQPFTRIQSAVMIVRLLGKEKEAQEKNYSHPFTDVSWGHEYVGYLYENGITKGVSETKFGSNEVINANSYMVLLLRTLGYSDKDGEFNWQEGLKFAKDKGFITKEDYNELSTEAFIRDHVVKCSYKALYMKLKNGEILSDKLSDDKIIDKSLLE